MPKTNTVRPRSFLTVGVVAVVVAALALAVWWLAASATSAQPAAAAPSPALPQGTSMGTVELVTTDLARMRSFYVDAVGLEVLKENTEQVRLGIDDEALLTLTLKSDRTPDVPTAAGLYHSAILYPDAPALARTLQNIAGVAPQSYSGSADHSVSLAFYFTDPDGNGLELYTDTPEDTWEWRDGLVTMGAAPLDPNAFIATHLGKSEGTEGTEGAVMGHVHLRVGNLDEARVFYADILGFDVTAESDGALFYSAGGYHHHLATNTWLSDGATERASTTGLGHFTVNLGDAAALFAIAERLNENGRTFSREGNLLTVDDPWGNTVHIVGAGA